MINGIEDLKLYLMLILRFSLIEYNRPCLCSGFEVLMDVCANRASVVDNRSAEVAAAEGKQATEAATEFAKVRAAEKAALIQAQAAAEVQQVINTARAERAQLRQTRELQLTRVFMSRGRFVDVIAECYIHWCRVWASNRIFRKGAWENDAAKEKRALEQQE